MTVDAPADAAKAAKILLIDDNALTRSVLRTILRQGGFQAIREAADAKAGLAVAQRFTPDLICLDIQMPGKTGLELLSELKACVPRAAVLMITASGDASTVKACVASHADGFIVKPFSADTLLKAVEGALNKAGQVRSAAPESRRCDRPKAAGGLTA
jgi:two-component system chemotaxis response regulator CheY